MFLRLESNGSETTVDGLVQFAIFLFQYEIILCSDPKGNIKRKICYLFIHYIDV